MHVLLFLLPRGPPQRYATQWPSVSWVAFAFGAAPSCGCTVLLVGLGRQPTRRTNSMQCHHLATKQRQHLDCKRAPRQHPRAEPQCAPGSAQLERVRTLEAARGRKHDAQPPGAFSAATQASSRSRIVPGASIRLRCRCGLRISPAQCAPKLAQPRGVVLLLRAHFAWCVARYHS